MSWSLVVLGDPVSCVSISPSWTWVLEKSWGVPGEKQEWGSIRRSVVEVTSEVLGGGHLFWTFPRHHVPAGWSPCITVHFYSQFTNVAVRSDLQRSTDAYQAKEHQDDTWATSASQWCRGRLVTATSGQNISGALHSGRVWLLMTVCHPILFSTDCKDT